MNPKIKKMAGTTSIVINKRKSPRATGDSLPVRVLVVGVTLAFFLLFLLFPLVVIFQEAFSKGAAAFIATFYDSYTRHSILLTLAIAAISVPLNTIFGIAAAWCVTRYRFRGRSFLITLIDLPLWISPVIAGLLYVLVFGAQGWLGPWLRGQGIHIIFAVPGMVLVTIFVTFPFVARGLIPLMQAQGIKEEEAALTLGANGWQILLRITLPKIKWGLLYGVILCNARAMGEFGAVSVVSGHIRGKTNTLPLQIEILYNEYLFAQAFGVASVFVLLAIATLILKTRAEWRAERELRDSLSTTEP